jgi:dihydrofolate synthase / folylpolyglutamate synthase
MRATGSSPRPSRGARTAHQRPSRSSAGAAYRRAVQFLYDLRLHGLKLGLENTRRLCDLAGQPQERLRFIHVAGTNGKGSTCAMLESIYRAAGLRVGLFTSPHLVSFRERIQINRRWISETEVVRGVQRMRARLPQFSEAHPPTFFEVVTVLAFEHFAARGCDLVVLETGMGGRLDATNVVTPMACLITNIQFDHQQWLGTSRAEIAAEKAGIIKPGVPVLTTADDPEALAVISRTASRQGAPLAHVSMEDLARAGVPADFPLPLHGAHQRLNAALAAATVQTLQNSLPVPPRLIRDGLRAVDWSGRMQLVHRRTGQDVLLDGAHNPAGFEALAQAIETEFPGRRPVFIIGILEDKDWRSMCARAVALAGRVIAVPVCSERSAAPADLVAACRSTRATVPAKTARTLAEAMETVRLDPFVVIAGSLYLVGEALERLGLAAAAGATERGLNEWSVRHPPPGPPGKSL